jgi:mannose-6-phosphate isomerase-like protein (cupin superfamily)
MRPRPESPDPSTASRSGGVEIFYVIEGTMSILVDEEWLDAPRGSLLRIPAGVTHTFENRSRSRAGALDVFLPGGGWASDVGLC